jgi:hypothetical protein
MLMRSLSFYNRMHMCKQKMMDAINDLKKKLESVSYTAAAAKGVHEADVKKKDGVCVCARACVVVYVCTHACVHVFMLACCVRVCVVCMCACVRACRYMCMCMCVQVSQIRSIPFTPNLRRAQEFASRDGEAGTAGEGGA